MTNLLVMVSAVVSNTVVATYPVKLVPVYECRKVYDDPDCFPCHRPYLTIVADCSCKHDTVISHYVIEPLNETKDKRNEEH